MLEIILKMYTTLMPTIMAGIFNMIWCKMSFLKALSVPMDGGRKLADGKRIFGDNKTWKGFLGYIVLNLLMTCIWGWLCAMWNIELYNFFYINHENILANNILIGILMGLAYSLFELPNSFIKRRLDIVPGKTSSGTKKYFFIVLDQADSVIGCVLAISLFYNMNLLMILGYILLGTLTHIILNMLLYSMKLRKNMF